MLKNETVRLSAEDLESIPGFYATETGLINVTARNNNLWIRLQGNELKLVPRPGQQFSLQFLLLGFIPIRLAQLDSAPWFGYPTVQGRTLVAAITDGKRRVMGEKVSPAPIPAAWLERIGKWASANADGTRDPTLYVVLRRDGEFLMADILVGDSVVAAWALTPRGDREAVIAGIGRNLGETMWVETSGGEERLMFSGYELKKLAD